MQFVQKVQFLQKWGAVGAAPSPCLIRATVTIDPDNKRTTQILDGNGNATSVTDPLGKIWSYLFDKLDRATVTTDPVGEVVSVTFDADGNLLTEDEDDDGGETSETNVYDAAGQQIAEVDAAGARTTSLYDKAGNLTGTLDAAGRLTQSLYDVLNRLTVTVDAASQRTTTLYDARGFVTGTLDARNKLTQYLVDGLGRSTVTVDAEGGRTTSVYDAAGRATQVYDPRNNLTQYVYDAAGKVTVVIDADSKRTTSLYDTAGNLTVVIDALNRRTTTVFDSNNRSIAVVDALGNRTSTYYDAAGHVTGVKDARSQLTQYLYDDAGRLTVTVDAGDGRTTQIYDDDGRVSAVRNANNYLTTYLYDSLNRATVTIDAENNRVTALYDVAGRQTGLIDGRGNLTQYELDALGRASVVIDGASKRTTTLYDANGNVTSIKDANNNVTEFLYDALNRKTVTLDPRGTYRTTMLYDAASNLTSMRDAQNNVTTFAYDSLNRKTRETDPLGEAATFTYNAVGLLTSTTDRLARRRDFQYDAANRLTTETWFTSGTAVETILYSYDAVGNRLTAQNGVGTYTMTYDALNRATVVNGLWGVTLTMAYDAVGNRTRVEDNLGGVVTSTYDKANRLTQRKLDAGTPEIRADQTYNGAHQIETQTRWSDLTGSTKVGSTTYTYDAVNRVTSIDHRNGSGTLLATYLYSYKDNGELQTQKINGGATTTYGYDAASQLTADDATNYTYDGTGNRTISGYSTGTGNRLTSDGTWDYSYDDEGNRTQQSLGQNAETWEYGYDHRNQMTAAEQWSADEGQPREQWSAAEYRYDAYGNRVEKVVESGEGFGELVPQPEVERYALDGWKTGPQGSFVGLENWDVWADLDGDNALQVRYLRGDVIDQLFARVASGSAKWELVDRLGSVLAETDSAGAVASNITYDGFGNTVSGSLPGRYQYTGREKDVETGLQYNRGRYYDAATGRWTSQDPKRFDAGDSNLYRYINNGVVNATDPSGLQARPLTGHHTNNAGRLEWRIEVPDQLGKGIKSQIWFRPSEKNKNAAIGFLQVVLISTVGGKASAPPVKNDPTYWKKFAAVGEMLWIDHQPGDLTSPFYNARPDGKGGWTDRFDKDGVTPLGSVGWGPQAGTGVGRDAYMIDTPGDPYARMGLGKAVAIFETVVVDLYTNDVLASLIWGYEVPDHPLDPIKVSTNQGGDAASPFVKWAVSQWNKVGKHQVTGPALTLPPAPPAPPPPSRRRAVPAGKHGIPPLGTEYSSNPYPPR